MYYVNEDDGQFFRVNLDGSGAEKIIDQFFKPGGHGLAVHRADGKLYWSSSYGVNAPEPPGFLALGSIGRSNLDGSNIEILISGGLNQGMVVAAPVPEPGSILLASIAAGFVALTVPWRRVRR